MDSIPRTSGIYQILCVPTGKIYIGSSRILAKRWKRHQSDLAADRHRNRYLQFAWNKYGCAAFEFSVLEETPVERLLDREQFYLDARAPFAPHGGFNVRHKADSPLGLKHSPASKQKMSDARKGRTFGPLSPEHRAAVSRGQIGKIVSSETRAKISATTRGRKGVPHSPEWTEKIAAAQRGKKRGPLSAAQKEKLVSVRGATWFVGTPDGESIIICNLARFCREHGLTQNVMSTMEARGQDDHRGYRCRRLE